VFLAFVDAPGAFATFHFSFHLGVDPPHFLDEVGSRFMSQREKKCFSCFCSQAKNTVPQLCKKAALQS
jgi:hypothetical protein